MIVAQASAMPDSYAVPRLGLLRAAFPNRPRTINLQANNVCNSRCIMCKIWENGPSPELTIEQLAALLRDPIFAAVEHVGVTGGEPTLRHELGAMYAVFPRALPAFRGASFITHGMNPERIVRTYGAIHADYRHQNLGFSGMVSLDGLGEIHDRVRGIPGAFAKTVRTLTGLMEMGIPVIACCTIVRANVDHLDALLDWGIAAQIPLRFRMAEFIARLGNDRCDDQIRAHDADELRLLVCFFDRLIRTYEHDPAVLRTYRSIQHQLTGGPRLIGCPYRTGDAINLDHQGRFAICAPKGVPQAMNGNGLVAVALAADERMAIAQRHCRSCIHDYHAEWVDDAPVRDEADPIGWSQLYGRLPAPEQPAASQHARLTTSAAIIPTVDRILVTGWYGTETVGDVAILRGILAEYRGYNSRLQFIISSLNPEWTRQTVNDLPATLRATVADVIAFGGAAAQAAMASCAALVVAGGPLMDIPDLRLLACLAARFRARGCPVLIEGCGLGPLTKEVHRNEAAVLLSHAQVITLRDRASVLEAERLCPGVRCAVRDDPAIACVAAIAALPTAPAPVPSTTIRAFLRAPTAEYPLACTVDAAVEWCAKLLRMVLQNSGMTQVEFYPMNTLAAGGDDRRFALAVSTSAELRNASTMVMQRPHTPEGIVAAMTTAHTVVCMRYHSIVFARTLRCRFLAIDYTGGGKTAAFLSDHGLDGIALRLGNDRVLDPQQLDHCLQRTICL